MQLGEQKYGFTLIDKQVVESMGITAYRFSHKKSGAELLWLQNQDENKTFSIGFKTLPENNTGVFHILEHSVLCGSKKYPLKEPFVDLLKGSMQTFLNAMTFPDKTMYPVASTNEKDFMNLVDVYMSSVFEPLIYEKEEIFMQEGWHLVPASEEQSAALTGVVYNEMKGSYSSPDSCLHRALIGEMMPDTPYRFSSGGNPPYIPDLTYQEFLETHKRFYHPDNAYIFLYGNLNLDVMLAYLDNEYLNAYEDRNITFDIPMQSPIGDKIVYSEYELSKGEKIEGNTMIGRGVALTTFENTKDILGMRILLDALTSTNTAPLKNAILDAKLGENFLAWVDDGLQQTFVTFLLKKTDAAQAEKFLEVLNNTFAELAEKGIDRDLLEGQLNSLAFSLREMDLGAAPGVMFAVMTMDTWLYGGDPVDALRQAEIIEILRAEMNEGYFENLIRKYLLNANHAVTLVMTPSHTLGETRLVAEQERAVAFEAQLTSEDMAIHMTKLERLDAYQQGEDTPEAKATLPHLERSDMRREISTTSVIEKTIKNIATREYVLPTNGIGYLNLYFGCDAYGDEDSQYMYLLTGLLFDLPTQQHDSLSFRNLQLLKLGSVSADLDGYILNEDQSYHPMFKVSCSFFEENLPYAISIINEGLFKTVFDREELKQSIRQEMISMESSMLSRGHTYASYRAASGLRESYRFYDLTEGISYYNFLKNLVGKLDHEIDAIAEKLENLLASLINADTLTISITGSQSLLDAYENTAFEFESKGVPARHVVTMNADQVKHGQKIAGSVVYNAAAIDLSAVGMHYDGTAVVLQKILSLDYMWNKVRVQGGAYGANARCTIDGLLVCSSYRDPNLERTYEAYAGVVDYLLAFDANEEDMTKYIIGVFSSLDIPEKAKEQASNCDHRYFSRITDEERQERRDQILAVTADDIRETARFVSEAYQKYRGICTVGASDAVDTAAALFDTIE